MTCTQILNAISIRFVLSFREWLITCEEVLQKIICRKHIFLLSDFKWPRIEMEGMTGRHEMMTIFVQALELFEEAQIAEALIRQQASCYIRHNVHRKYQLLKPT